MGIFKNYLSDKRMLMEAFNENASTPVPDDPIIRPVVNRFYEKYSMNMQDEIMSRLARLIIREDNRKDVYDDKTMKAIKAKIASKKKIGKKPSENEKKAKYKIGIYISGANMEEDDIYFNANAKRIDPKGIFKPVKVLDLNATLTRFTNLKTKQKYKMFGQDVTKCIQVLVDCINNRKKAESLIRYFDNIEGNNKIGSVDNFMSLSSEERANRFGIETTQELEALLNASGYPIEHAFITRGNKKVPENSLLINISSATYCPSVIKNGCTVSSFCYARNTEYTYVNSLDKNEQNRGFMHALFKDAQRKDKENPNRSRPITKHGERPENMDYQLFFDLIESYIQTANGYTVDENTGELIPSKYKRENIKFLRFNENGDIGFGIEEDPTHEYLAVFIKELDEFARYIKYKYDIGTFMYCAYPYADFTNTRYLTVNASNDAVKLPSKVMTVDKNGNEYETTPISHNYRCISPYEYNRLEDTTVDVFDRERLIFRPRVKKMFWRPTYKNGDNKYVHGHATVQYYYKCPCGAIPFSKDGELLTREGDFVDENGKPIPIPANFTCRGCYACFRNTIKAIDDSTGEDVTDYIIVSKIHGGKNGRAVFKGIRQAPSDKEIGFTLDSDNPENKDRYDKLEFDNDNDFMNSGKQIGKKWKVGENIPEETNAEYINYLRKLAGEAPINFDKDGIATIDSVDDNGKPIKKTINVEKGITKTKTDSKKKKGTVSEDYIRLPKSLNEIAAWIRDNEI